MIWNNWSDFNSWRDWFEQYRLVSAEPWPKNQNSDPEERNGEYPLLSEEDDETHPAYVPWAAFEAASQDCRSITSSLSETQDRLERYEAFVRWMKMDQVFDLYAANYDPLNPDLNP